MSSQPQHSVPASAPADLPRSELDAAQNPPSPEPSPGGVPPIPAAPPNVAFKPVSGLPPSSPRSSAKPVLRHKDRHKLGSTPAKPPRPEPSAPLQPLPPGSSPYNAPLSRPLVSKAGRTAPVRSAVTKEPTGAPRRPIMQDAVSDDDEATPTGASSIRDAIPRSEAIKEQASPPDAPLDPKIEEETKPSAKEVEASLAGGAGETSVLEVSSGAAQQQVANSAESESGASPETGGDTDEMELDLNWTDSLSDAAPKGEGEPNAEPQAVVALPDAPSEATIEASEDASSDAVAEVQSPPLPTPDAPVITVQDEEGEAEQTQNWSPEPGFELEEDSPVVEPTSEAVSESEPTQITSGLSDLPPPRKPMDTAPLIVEESQAPSAPPPASSGPTHIAEAPPIPPAPKSAPSVVPPIPAAPSDVKPPHPVIPPALAPAVKTPPLALDATARPLGGSAATASDYALDEKAIGAPSQPSSTGIDIALEAPGTEPSVGPPSEARQSRPEQLARRVGGVWLGLGRGARAMLAGGAVVLAALVLYALLSGSSKPEATAPQAKSTPVADQKKAQPSAAAQEAQTSLLEKAAMGDEQAVGQLEAKPAHDLTVQEVIALAHGRTALKRNEIESLGKAISDQPERLKDPETLSKLKEYAWQDDVAISALEVIASTPSATAADLLYEIWVGTKERKLSTVLARNLVYSSMLRKAASPALEAALQLREAKECEQVAQAVASVTEHGDVRSLRLLAKLPGRGCGDDGQEACACLELKRLRTAVRAVRDRPAPEL